MGSPVAHDARTLRLAIETLAEGADLAVVPPPGEEAVVVLVEGGIGGALRESPFSAPAAAWYLPPGSHFAVRARLASSVAVVTTRDAGLDRTDEAVVSIAGGSCQTRGRDEWERLVTTLVDAGTGARRLLVGETAHGDGGWSSYPPHRHDGSGGEPYFEEIYHYRFDPPDGFGFQGLYTDAAVEARMVRDGDTLTIERGYHPVCAAPGYRLRYLWALCGPAARFEPVEDPRHAWLADR